jgi:DDT domain
MRNQFKVFQKFYPELVEKHSIKYPIEDKFIQLLPLLHGADKVPPKPQPKKILIDGVSFERVLYIWEFFTNFADFFNIATFKIEELQAALFLAADGQPLFDPPQNLAEGEEPDWEDYISNKTVIESGFGLVNSLMLAIVDCFFNEAKNNTEEKGAETKDTTN